MAGPLKAFAGAFIILLWSARLGSSISDDETLQSSIDLLQEWNTDRSPQHLVRSLMYKSDHISC